ncbi:hypothetical protein ScPMuIL_008842 [Solemya velum]
MSESEDFYNFRSYVLRMSSEADCFPITTEFITVTTESTTTTNVIKVIQSTEPWKIEDDGAFDKDNLVKLIGGVSGGLIFFAIVIVITLAMSCAKKRRRRNSGNSMSMTRTSNLDDYEVYAQINESYVIDEPVNHQADVMLPTRKKKSGLYHHFTKRFVRWFSIDGTDVTENVAEPHAMPTSDSSNRRARERFRAVSESGERAEPLLDIAPALPARDHVYNTLVREPTNGDYAALPASTPDPDRQSNTFRQSGVFRIDDDAVQPEGDYFILEKEEDQDIDNGSDGAIVLAEDFREGYSDNTDRCSVVRTSYLVPITKLPRNINCVQLHDSVGISTNDDNASLYSSNKDGRASDCSHSYLELLQKSNGCSEKKSGVERSSSEFTTHSGGSPVEAAEQEKKPSEYFILEKDELSPEESSDVIRMPESHSEFQLTDNRHEESSNNIPPNQIDNESPGGVLDSDKTSTHVSEYYVLEKPEHSDKTSTHVSEYYVLEKPEES